MARRRKKRIDKRRNARIASAKQEWELARRTRLPAPIARKLDLVDRELLRVFAHYRASEWDGPVAPSRNERESYALEQICARATLERKARAWCKYAWSAHPEHWQRFDLAGTPYSVVRVSRRERLWEIRHYCEDGAETDPDGWPYACVLRTIDLDPSVLKREVRNRILLQIDPDGVDTVSIITKESLEAHKAPSHMTPYGGHSGNGPA